MTMVIQLVSSDETILSEVKQAVTPDAIEMSQPAPMEDAASLNLDLTAVSAIWDALIAVGQLASAMQVVQSVVDLLAKRGEQAGPETTVNVVVNGATITFSGRMSPKEATQRIAEFRQLAGEALDAS